MNYPIMQLLVWHQIEKLLYILKILQSLLVLFIFTYNNNKKKVL